MSRPTATFKVIRHKLTIKTGPRAVGGGGTSRYVWTQAVAATTWTITHTLSDFSHVTFLDAAGRVFLGPWQRISATQIIAGPFSPAQSGTAHIS